MQAGLSTKNAPSAAVVLPHFAFGAVAFLAASVILFFVAPDLVGHYLSPHLLSLTHLLVLGWISMVIFGSLYQLIPVVMEVKLYSEKLAIATFILFGSGLVILSVSFWSFNFGHNMGIDIGGTLVLLAVILFAWNAIKSAAKTERKTIENTFIITAVIWLVITVILAIVIVLNFSMHFISTSHLQLLKTHAHMGLAGWFLLLVIGVASKLMPMFLIVHKLPKRLLTYAYYLINGGLVLLSVAYTFYPQTWFLTFSGLLIVSGIVLFLRFNQLAFGKRLRKKLDVGMKMSAMGFILLALTLLLGLTSLLKPEFFQAVQLRIDMLYGVLIIFGFLSSLVLGQTYKTLPFIIWLKKYHSKVGKQKVPLPQELYSDKVANRHFYTYLAGIIFLVAGMLMASVLVIRIAAALIFVTGLLYNYNVFKILFHKEKVQ
ncbi:MAG: hypothetical protein L3J31_04505 [Bacteroidales bacterium]|nr:hypothetical protein [Bacteroidales bacterium]MCF6342047.1 hypothetical protein [Bacteroidales bacterium]